MDRKRWQKIEPILDEALRMDNSQKRKEYIREVCDSVELYQEVANLIASIEEAEEDGFLE